MASVEDRNMERARRWEWAWNNDVMRMVDECYAEACEVTDVFRDRTFRGREELRLIEKQMIEADVSRRMQVTKMVAAGDTVAMEIDAWWGEGAHVVKNVGFLTFNEDGLIVTDHSYGADPTGAAERDPRTEAG